MLKTTFWFFTNVQHSHFGFQYFSCEVLKTMFELLKTTFCFFNGFQHPHFGFQHFGRGVGFAAICFQTNRSQRLCRAKEMEFNNRQKSAGRFSLRPKKHYISHVNVCKFIAATKNSTLRSPARPILIAPMEKKRFPNKEKHDKHNAYRTSLPSLPKSLQYKCHDLFGNARVSMHERRKTKLCSNETFGFPNIRSRKTN